MKKGMMLALCGLAFAPALFAAEDNQCSRDKERIIQYTVTVYREGSDFDTEKWGAMTNDANRAISCGRGAEEGDVLEAVMAGLKNMYTDGKGIHGEITVSVSSGECEQESCKGCDCKKRYNGMCPCPTMKVEDCKGACSEEDGKACMETCKKACETSGCDMEKCKEMCKRMCDEACEASS